MNTNSDVKQFRFSLRGLMVCVTLLSLVALVTSTISFLCGLCAAICFVGGDWRDDWLPVYITVFCAYFTAGLIMAPTAVF